MEFVDLGKQYRAYQNEINFKIQQVLDTQHFILGPQVKELEETLAAFVGVKNAIAVASGTDALLISLMALSIKPGDEVVTTPFTFISTAEVISLLGAKPVFVDIDPITYNLNPSLLKKALKKRTKAIIPVSLYGQCADFQAINTLAQKRGIPVIEDGAQSFGARSPLGLSCGMTTLGCTSFFPSKPFGCYGDGGMIFTQDDALASATRSIRVHGQKERYQHHLIGLNGRLDTLQAAILLAKWPHFQEELQKRDAAARYYEQKLKDLPGIILPKTSPGNTHVWAQYSIQVDQRDMVCAKLKEKGIPTAIHYPKPLHLQSAFSFLKYQAGDFPASENLAQKIFSLPMHPFITSQEQDLVVEAIRAALS